MSWRKVETRPVPVVLTTLGLGLLALGGCGGDSFAPPPSPELQALPVERPAEAKVLSVDLILMAKPTPTTEIWEDAARREAGLTKTFLHVRRPEADAPPAAQAALIRNAVGREVSALLVDPVDAPEVTEALNDAVARGTVVVLLDHAVPARDPSKPMARVSFTPIAEPARRLVEALADDIQRDGLPVDGHILIGLRHDADRQGREIADGLVAALKAAHFGEARIVPLESDVEKATRTLVDQTLADPKVTGLLGIARVGFEAAANAHNDLLKQAKRLVSVGACVTINRTSEITVLSRSVGVVDHQQSDLIRKAFRLAVSLARGEPVPLVQEVPVKFQQLDPQTDLSNLGLPVPSVP